uniref:Neuropeptide Grb-AST B4 n=1 Tax=Gryllus bimaculatus TaxID=6999 RepID=Q7M3N6_GRYBI|nr:juvenile hormone inhibitory neuropeptide grb-AST:SUBUNIT=B4 [Gryllus bimaculatus]
AWERFHGSW